METEKNQKYNRGGRALGGLIVVIVGVFLLMKSMGVFIFPHWLFTWPMLMIVIGLYIGIRHRFYGWGGWFVMILIGGFFLIRDYFSEYQIADYLWPIGVIALGLYIMLRPRRHYDWDMKHQQYGEHYRQKWQRWERHQRWSSAQNIPPSGEDYIESVSIFGETNKIVISKNFKGGDIVNIFGGCNLNLTQADFTGTITLEVVQIFGGTKIIVPPDWKIITKMTSVFGGVEDTRSVSLIKENPEKTLILDGTSIFGGISLQCY